MDRKKAVLRFVLLALVISVTACSKKISEQMEKPDTPMQKNRNSLKRQPMFIFRPAMIRSNGTIFFI